MALQKSLVVIAIAGLYRAGKSYLMNRLAGKTKGSVNHACIKYDKNNNIHIVNLIQCIVQIATGTLQMIGWLINCIR